MNALIHKSIELGHLSNNSFAWWSRLSLAESPEPRAGWLAAEVPLLFFGVLRRAVDAEEAVVDRAAEGFKNGGEVAGAVAVKGGGDFRLFRGGEEAVQVHVLAGGNAFGDVAHDRAGGEFAFAGDVFRGLAGM